ncbi:MAG: DHA2 family efflux MFS transporter permease subunit [Chloroflexi bacterium]|nr:DHA2 family efflux MFS transporter permease subunit [Chloroflexota bacterium]
MSNPPPDAESEQPDLSRAWRVLAITSFASFAAALDASIMFVAFPDIRSTFDDVSTAQLSWVINSYNIVFAALLVPAGQFADRIGRKRAFFTGIAIFTLSSAVAGAAVSPGMLIGARVVQAAGAALLFPAALALVLREFPRSKRATAVGVFGAAAGLAAAIGPSFGSLLIEASSWRLAFYINLPIGAIVIALGARVLVESREADAPRVPDFLGIGLLISGIGSLALAVVQGSEWGWADARTLVAFAAAAVLIPLFVLRSDRAANPVLDLTLFRNHNFRIANLATLTFVVAFSAMFFGLILFLTTTWRYSTVQAGLLMTPGPVIAAFVAVGAGRLIDRIGHRPLMVPGGIIYAIGGAWMFFGIGAEREILTVWLPAILFAGIGIGLVLPALASAAAHGLPEHRFAVGGAVNAAFRQIGFVMGVAIVVALLGSPDDPDSLLDSFDRIFVLLIVGGLATAAIVALLDTRPAAAESAPAVTAREAVSDG